MMVDDGLPQSTLSRNLGRGHWLGMTMNWIIEEATGWEEEALSEISVK